MTEYIVDFCSFGGIHQDHKIFETTNIDDIIPYICAKENITRDQYDKFISFPVSIAEEKKEMCEYMRSNWSREQDQIPYCTYKMPTIDQIQIGKEYNLLKSKCIMWYFVACTD